MAVTTDPSGKAAPKGGFQTGGWYSGYQYWDGSFAPKAGVIHSSSNQQGAGQAVNPTVVAATNTAQGLKAGTNEAYIAKQNATSTQTPTTKEQLPSFLDNFQSGLYNSATSPETKVPTVEELKSELMPTTAKPELLNRTAEFDKLRTEQGVADLETNLNDLKAQQDEIAAQLNTNKISERGKPVAMNVIEGRISEEQQQAQEQSDYIGRQITRVTDQLTTKYNVINTYMNFMGLDYQDAVASYDKEYQQNLQFYELVQGAKKQARSEWEYDQTAAKANLTVYANAITSGNMSYANLDPTQKAMINKLEVQSGLPVGFMSNLTMSAGDKILGISDDKTQAWVVGDDGNMKVIQTGLRKSVGTGSDAKVTLEKFKSDAQEGSSFTFPDLVEKYAPTMSLEQIYEAYNNSGMGIKWGEPQEDRNITQLRYKWAKGEITDEEVKAKMSGTGGL